jgi:nicotinamide phosphoribosyltransferase
MRHTTPATLLCDFYKISHRAQYPDKTEVVYSTWTPRSNKYFPRAESVVAFGAQGMIKKILIDYFNENFFSRPIDDVVAEYARYIKYTLFIENPETKHIEELHELGYMPLHIKALPEGTLVPMRVPMLTVHNVDSRFFWLTNYIETLASTEMWLTSTAATIALSYRSILDEYALKTAGSTDFVPFQGHDFSMRGMAGIDAAMLSGAGHLLSFVGTDTVPAIAYLERYYNADIEKELVGTSVNATEHSVMCAGGADNEFETYRRLISEVYPTGIISIVSDTWDLFGCLETIIKPLKPEIMARDGKVVIRPDSGDPVDIICGDLTAEEGSQEYKGVVECLYDIFGGEKNAQGYIELDSHIGAIYGDSITPERCEAICYILAEKGFASTNVVFGIGSYTYQYNTRDTFGFAMKSTMVVIDGEEKMIFKDPKTDDGTKKSNTGCVAVQMVDGELVCKDRLALNHTEPCLMQTIFLNGELKVDETLAAIRARISS